jgi:hypothetical protein
MKVLFEDVFGLSLSEGTIDNILKEMNSKAETEYKAIKERIKRSTVVGPNETDCHANGKKHWMYIW